MRMKGRLGVVLLAATLLCGCSPNDFIRRMMDRMAPTEDVALAMTTFAALRAGDFTAVIERLDPQFVTSDTESDLAQMATILNQGELVEIELIGTNLHSTPDRRRTVLTYQYQLTDGWALASMVIDTIGEQKSIYGINVQPLPTSLAEVNAFTLTGKSLRHYVMLGFAIAVPLFILWTVYLCARTKIEKKALWIFFILIGITRIQLNWTTGQMGFQPIGFQIPGAGISKMGLYAPWILTVSVPLGAIWFQIKRRKQRTAGADTEQDATGAPPKDETAE